MFSIKEVAKISGLSEYTLRFYEKEGIIPPINRDKNGRREFTPENLYWIEIVTCLKMSHMKNEDIKSIVKLSMEGVETISARKKILEDHREEMIRQREQLDKTIEKVTRKIDFYAGVREDC